MNINKPEIKLYLVLCGNKAEFDYFCKIKRQEYEDGNREYENCEFYYYSGSEAVRGRCFYGIIELRNKECTFCNNVLPEDKNNFYLKNKNKPELGFMVECKSCLRKRSLKNRDKRLNEYREFSRKYTREHPEEIKTANKKYRREKKEEKKKYQKEYFESNKDKLHLYSEKRKSKIHDISKKEWNNCKDYFNNSCAYCGMSEEEHREIYRQDFHKEHVDDDGANDLSNCVPSCKGCNSSKWNFSIDEWYNKENPDYKNIRLRKIIKWINKDFIKYKE